MSFLRYLLQHKPVMTPLVCLSLLANCFVLYLTYGEHGAENTFYVAVISTLFLLLFFVTQYAKYYLAKKH